MGGKVGKRNTGRNVGRKGRNIESQGMNLERTNTMRGFGRMEGRNPPSSKFVPTMTDAAIAAPAERKKKSIFENMSAGLLFSYR
jgi:hypothetical protein